MPSDAITIREVPDRKKVVIVGAGFAGLEAAKALRRAPVDVLVIDKQNHHLFQPLLYQVATAGLSPANIAAPIRRILRRSENTRVILAEVTGIDRQNRTVRTTEGDHPYDFLILATGAKNWFFGNERWPEFAPGLKTLADATGMRARILSAFEDAEIAPPEEQQQHLTFVIVGGGPTGVELAGAIAELARRAIASDFRAADPQNTRIVLVEGGDRLLSNFPEKLSDACLKSLEKLSVEVHLGCLAQAIDGRGVETEAGRIEARTVLWAAGIRSTPVAEWLGVDADGLGRVIVGDDLTIPGSAEVFVCGDCAHVKGADGNPLPGVCQPAMQEGVYAARSIIARLQGRALPPFRYKDKGTMATIGRKMAVCEIGRLKISGFFAWVLWLFVHVFYLIGFRNRLLTLFDWAWAYVTFERGARLIVKKE
ncbi:MAG: NAD(P)/FAD-dependent oxidoreductase [Armatimonadetes bacterium]|nr:NAD(P)/FAD-dependent oxidoreductase [Armatimonadota bacterium]